jgi:hypothetical protein
MITHNKQFLTFKWVFIFFLFKYQLISQELERPFILVKASEREEVLDKIKNQPWANDIYLTLKIKTDAELVKFYQNPSIYIQQLPFNWSEKIDNNFPPFLKTDHIENGNHKNKFL